MTEEAEQITLIQWADTLAPQHPELAMLFHVPNGGYRARRTAGRMKAAGQRKGVPDLWLPIPRRGYHGLVIELKAAKGRPTPEQSDWLARLNAEGYKATIQHGWIEAARNLAWYLDLPTEVIP